MRIPLALTGFNLVVAAVAVLLYFVVDPSVSVTVLFAALGLHTVRPFLAVLDASDEEDSGTAWKDASVLLAQLSRDAVAGSTKDRGRGPGLLGGLFVEDAAPRWDFAPADERAALEATFREATGFVREEALGEALKRYRKLAKSLSADPAVHHNLGILYLASGDLVRARANLLRALFFRRDDPAIYAALVEAAPGPVELAERAFRRATELAPDDPRPHLRLARFHLLQGRPDQAEAVMERLIGEKAPAAGGLLLRGWAKLLQSKPADAAADFRESVAAEPWSCRGRIGQGFAALLAGQRKPAERAFSEAIELARGSEAAAIVVGALFGRALAAAAAGERDRAAGCAAAIREIDPEHRGAILVQALAAWGQAPAAEDDPSGADLRPLVSGERPPALAAHLLGRRLLAAGAAEAALASFEVATRAAPGAGRERFALGVASILAGRTERLPEILEGLPAPWTGRGLVALAVGRMLNGQASEGREALAALAGAEHPDPLAFQALAAVHAPGGTLEERLRRFLVECAGAVLERPEPAEFVRSVATDVGCPLV